MKAVDSTCWTEERLNAEKTSCPVMTVCFITNASAIGGAERVLLETIELLRERGLQCRVLAGGSGEVERALAAAGVPCEVHRVGSWISWHKPSLWDRVKTIAKVALAVRFAAKHVRKWNCDAIYSNGLTVCHGALVAKLLGLPHIWHLHEFGREDHGVWYEFGERFTNYVIGASSSMCIAVSNALARKYSKYIPPSKLAVIYPSMHMAATNAGVSPDEAAALPPHTGPLRLLVIGGLVEGKGQADAVRALAYIIKEGINAELTLVGEGFSGYQELLEDIVRSEGLGDRVHFVGRVRDASPLLQEADLLLVCSRSEAFGRATIEGMLAGKPVVGARCEATAELIQDGVTGLLYNCRDPRDLAAKIGLLHQDPGKARQIAHNGQHWAAARFTKERYADAVLNLLASVPSR